MRSEDLTPQQCRVLAKKFCNMQTELGRVKMRMRAQSYPHSDKLQLLVLQAFDVMQELRMHVHMGCVSKFADDPERPAKQPERIE